MSPQPLPYKDFTIKARVTNSVDVEQKLKDLKAEFIGTDHQTDHYFETSRGKLKWREALIENLITHYERAHESGVEKTIVYRYDLNPTQEEISVLRQTCKLIGVTQKLRKIYHLGHVKIHLDKLPNDDEFIELEAIDREGRFSTDDLKASCLELKTKLNIQDTDLVPTGYLRSDSPL